MDFLQTLGGQVTIGLETALSLSNIFYCFAGVTLGMFLGVIPGIGTLAAMSLLFPITFYLDGTSAVIMLAGIFYGTSYGGSTASILLNLPGTPSSAVTCVDGYPMAKQGRAGIALFMTAIASFFGATVGIIIMMLFAPIIAQFALRFGAAEYFSMILLGLVAASTISIGSPIKAIGMVVVGVALGTVGIDIYSGEQRFTFNIPELRDGINLVTVAMGLFGVSEIIASIRSGGAPSIDRKSITLRSIIPTRDDWRRSWSPMARGSGIGSFFGTLPGTGGTVAAFMSYAVERRLAREPERFGRGAIEGVVGPESANNAADQTAFIPTLTLGIPGSASMALILGVLLINGINPGPQLLVDQPSLFWGLVMSFWVGNVMLLILNIPLIGIWVRLLTVPYHLLYPAILVFVCIGVYSTSNNVFDVWMVIVFGLIGYGMRQLDFSPAPLILGFVLGPMLEEEFRRAMILSRGDPATFVERPLSGIFILMTVLLLAWGAYSGMRQRRANAASGRLNTGKDHSAAAKMRD